MTLSAGSATLNDNTDIYDGGAVSITSGYSRTGATGAISITTPTSGSIPDGDSGSTKEESGAITLSTGDGRNTAGRRGLRRLGFADD